VFSQEKELSSKQWSFTHLKFEESIELNQKQTRAVKPLDRLRLLVGRGKTTSLLEGEGERDGTVSGVARVVWKFRDAAIFTPKKRGGIFDEELIVRKEKGGVLSADFRVHANAVSTRER